VPTAEKNELTFLVLSDVGSAAAKAYGIAFDLAEELRPLYTRFGHALPDKNGDDSWILPIPATYVIDGDREGRGDGYSTGVCLRCLRHVVRCPFRRERPSGRDARGGGGEPAVAPEATGIFLVTVADGALCGFLDRDG
jgi:AhpC/TSA family